MNEEIEILKNASKEEIFESIAEILKSYENLPQHAMLLPINHYEFCSLLLLLQASLRAD